jgi:hypothetical protein
MHIRYYGLLANRHRTEKLQRIRVLLGQAPVLPSTEQYSTPSTFLEPDASKLCDTAELCPKCKKGWLVLVATLAPSAYRNQAPWGFDSS